MKSFILFAVLVFAGLCVPAGAIEYLPAKDFQVKPATQGDEYYLYLENSQGIAIPFLLMVPGPQATPSGAVVFLPQYMGTAAMWKTQARKATAAGVFSLSLQVDTAIKGKTTISWDLVDGAMEQVIAWLRSMPSVNPGHIGIVGSSMGGNHALRIFAADPRIAGVFSLSPGLDYYGYQPGRALAAVAGRQAVVAAAQDDGESYAALETWREKFPGVEYMGFAGGGHGYLLVQNQPEVAKRLQQFLLSLR